MAFGFVVVEINQASRWPTSGHMNIYDTAEVAEEFAAEARAETAKIGRREQHIVCELVPVDGEDRPMADDGPTPREAAASVRAWLDQFATLGGIDPEVAHTANYAQLRISHLRVLVAAAEREVCRG